jgi:hypothetical protein
MLMLSRELPISRKNEITDEVSENLEALRALLPDDFRDPKKEKHNVSVALNRWRKTVRKISLVKKFIFNLQESNRIRRYVNVLSHSNVKL